GMFQGFFGHKIMNATRARHSNVVGNAGQKNLLATVLETEIPADINAHYLSDRYLEKGDYLRLANLTLSYNLRNLGTQLKNVRLYANINNVFVITRYKGVDPEVDLGGLTPGIDNRQTYPRTRTFMFGLNFNLYSGGTSMKSKLITGFSWTTAAIILLVSCTDLDVDIKSQYTNFPDTERAAEAISADVYAAYRGALGRDHWMVQTLSSDEAVSVALGTDYYDGGRYREFHVHNWTPDNGILPTLWN